MHVKNFVADTKHPTAAAITPDNGGALFSPRVAL
jgi:hypothetical protein